MDLTSISTYLPVWNDTAGKPMVGLDEDVLTLAVAAGDALLTADSRTAVARIVLVCARPDFLEGSPVALIPKALGLTSTMPLEQRLGGADATLDAIVGGEPGTLVLAVDPGVPAGAGAVLLAEGDAITAAGSISHHLPVVVHAAGAPDPMVYDDPRLLRERGSRAATNELIGDAEVILVVGVAAGVAKSLSSSAAPVELEGLTGAASTIFALASLAEMGGRARVIAIDSGSATAADVGRLTGSVRRVARPRLSRPNLHYLEGTIPVSLAALDRAQDAKIGFLGGACQCGHIEFPPRYRCLVCGAETPTTLVPLGRSGEVYTTVTIHAPVPGMATPYTIAIIELEEPPLRVLAPVADSPPDSVGIGQRGRMVFRRVAIRQGVADYMHAFQPDLVKENS